MTNPAANPRPHAYKVEVYSNRTFPTYWGIKDQDTGKWVELRGLYRSVDFSAVEEQCESMKPCRCVCGYSAADEPDLDEHVLASMHVPGDHAKAR